jgi:hypothetical protein
MLRPTIRLSLAAANQGSSAELLGHCSKPDRVGINKAAIAQQPCRHALLCDVVSYRHSLAVLVVDSKYFLANIPPRCESVLFYTCLSFHFMPA